MALEQILVGGRSNTLNGGATEHNWVYGGHDWLTTEWYSGMIVAAPGKMRKLYIEISNAPGAGASWTFTLMLNGNPSALTCNIADAAKTGSNVANEVNVVAGDIISLRCEPSVAPAPGFCSSSKWSMCFFAQDATTSLIPGSSFNWSTDTALTEYFIPMGGPQDFSVTEADQEEVIPTGGTVSKFYVQITGPPGGGDSYTFTLRRNGGNTPVTVTIGGAATAGSDLLNSQAFNAGDRISVEKSVGGSPIPVSVRWGFKFVADIDGESLLMSGGRNSNIGAGHVSYTLLPLIDQTYRQLAQLGDLKKLHVRLTTAPGGGNSRQFEVEVNTIDTVLACTIADAAVACSDLVNTLNLADWDVLSMDVDDIVAPVASRVAWSMVVYKESADGVGGAPASGGMANKMIAERII